MNKILVLIFATILSAEFIFAGTLGELGVDTLGEIVKTLGAKDAIRFSSMNKEINAVVTGFPDIERFVRRRLGTPKDSDGGFASYLDISVELMGTKRLRPSRTDNFFVVKTPFPEQKNLVARTASLENELKKLKTKATRTIEEYSSNPQNKRSFISFNPAFLYIDVRNYDIKDITSCINGAYDKAMKECAQDSPAKECNVYSFICGLHISSMAE